MTVEKNMTRCKKCGDEKIRILDGKYNSTNKKWIDDSGSAWNGRLCPTCNKLRVKNKMKELRSE